MGRLGTFALIGVLVAAGVGGSFATGLLGGGGGNAGSPTYRIMWLSARAGSPSDENGCGTPTLTEYDTNKVNLYLAAFAGTDADDYIEWTAILPPTYRNNSPIYVTVWWTTATGDGGAAETVAWDFYALALTNDNPLDTSYGTHVDLTADTWIADGDVHITAESAALAIVGGASRGDLIQYRLARDISADDMEDYAQLIGVQVKFVGE